VLGCVPELTVQCTCISVVGSMLALGLVLDKRHHFYQIFFYRQLTHPGGLMTGIYLGLNKQSFSCVKLFTRRNPPCSYPCC
jgi:hypothetical protein